MKFNHLPSIHDIAATTAIRQMDGPEIVDSYASFTRSQFAEARRRDVVRPMIIPAHNEETDLPAALLAAARTGEAIPLVIDNRSDDGTATIARKMGAIVVEADNGRKMAATQEGLRFARHELGARALYFTDADTLVPAGWIHGMNRHIERQDEGNGVAVFGNSLLWHGKSRFTDTILSAAKIARAVKHTAVGGEIIARGHNYALSLDPNGQMEDAINSLDPSMFGGDDSAIRDILIDAGARVLNAADPATTVVTRNDRVDSLRQRVSRQYNQKRLESYDTQS